MVACGPSPKYLVLAGKADQVVMPVPAGPSSDHGKVAPPKSFRVMPRCSEYHFANAFGSCERRKTPPMPVIRAMRFSSDSRLHSFKRLYSPSTVTNSFTDPDDFCSIAFSSALSLI